MAAGSNNIVTDGLVYYADAGNRRSFPATGTTWTDVVNGNNGTLENMDTGGFDSQKGGVIEFDGTNEHVKIGAYGASSVLNWGSGNGTVGVWMKSDEHYGTLIAMGAAGSGGKRYLIQYDNSGNKISFAMDNDVTLKAANGSDTDGLTDGKWHYVVGMRNGQYIYLYVDGVLDATTDLGAGYGSVDYTSNGGLYMGGIWHVGDTVSHYWDGSLALAHIYNRALSADEVSQNYESLKPRFEPRIPKEGLMGYWDAGDPLCYDGNAFGQYSATWNLIDLCSGTVGEFFNGNPLPNFSLDNGGYWTFDGTDDGFWAGMGSNNDMYLQYSNANGITGIMWMNLASDGKNVFFWKNDMFQFRYDSSSKLNMRSGNASSWSTSADLQSAADLLTTDGSEWACVVASANKSNDAREIWLNGERVANDTGSGMVWGTDNERMGVAGGWGSDTLHGKVGMALLYSRALSAAEIKDFYNKTKARFGH